MSNSSLYIDENTHPVVLLLIDPQVDFHEGGSLAVPGSTADSLRIAQMIRNHIKDIDEIFVTFDSHDVSHIAHKAFWSDKKDGSGQSPPDFTTILSRDIGTKWYPVDESLMDYCIEYATSLEQKNRFQLTIWPDHCVVGTPGHEIQHNIQNAIGEWSADDSSSGCSDTRKQRTVKHVNKGMNRFTEMYSAIQAEVPYPADPSTARNMDFLAQLGKAKRLIVCGQALSHCVNYTVRDILQHWKEYHMDKLNQIYVLEDGCSSVPGFESEGKRFLSDMRLEGVTLTTTEHAFEGL